MKINTYIIVGICLFLLLGCTKELTYPDVAVNDFLVMNGLISPETGAVVHLSQSCHITDLHCSQKSIKNGEVILKDEVGNKLVELIHEEKGFYKAIDFKVAPDKIYTIEASSNGFETIQAKEKIPKSFGCSLEKVDERIISDYLCRTFEIEIQDNPDEVNYYLIDGWIDILNGVQLNIDLELNGYRLPNAGFLSDDINVDNNTMISNVDISVYPLEFIFLTDEAFNGQNYRLDFGLYLDNINLQKDLDMEAHINVKSVSKDLYDYYKSVTLYKLNSANILAEPQQIFSNIEAGIGIFGGFTEQEFIIDLPQTQFYIPFSFQIENSGCKSPCAVEFLADMGNKVNFFWDFGDGNTSTERNPSHEYQDPGVYDAQLQIALGDNNFIVNGRVEIR